MKKMISALGCMVALSGCVTQDYQNNHAENLKVKEDIEKHVSSINYEKAFSIELPPFDASEINNSSEPVWLHQRIAFSVAGSPLSDVLQQLINANLGDKPVELIYGENVDPHRLVSLKLPGGTIKEALNRLTTETDYGFVFKENRVEVERYITESFSIPLPPGVYSAQMGNQGTKGSGEGAIVEGQFINVVVSDENIVGKILTNINGLIGKKTTNENGEETVSLDGSVTAIDGLSLINVTTSPLKMRKVQSYIGQVKRELSKQALLDFRVIEFRSTSGNERGADLNLVRDVGEGTLQFFSQGTSLYSAPNGYGFSFKGINGWEGTTAFIKALEKQGTVSVQSPLTKLALNNAPVRVTQNKQNPYLEDLSVNVNEGVVTSAFKRGNVEEGVDFASVVNVQDDFAWIRVSGKLKSVINTEMRQVGSDQLRFYTTRDSDINFTGKLRYGRTYIIARVSQTKVFTDKTENYGTEYIGSNSTQKELVETLILLTPKRFEQ